MKNDPIQKLDRSKLKKLIESIYNDHNTQELDLICYQLMQILDDFQLKSGFNENNNNILWDQTHAVLITYADSVKKNNESSLLTLEKIVYKYFGSKLLITLSNYIWICQKKLLYLQYEKQKSNTRVCMYQYGIT